MIKYIAWVDIVPWKWIGVKRYSNWKWYNWDVILKQIKDFLINAENWKTKDQFFAEYKEITKIYWFFWLRVKPELVYTPPKKEIL